MVQSARSIARTGYAHRVHPVMPYAQYPQQYEESLVSPFNSFTYFGRGTWARTVRSAADSVREWREQGELLLRELQDYLGAHTTPWGARKLSLSDAGITGTVKRGARLHTYTVQIVTPARAETMCSYELAQNGLSIAEPGRHWFSVNVADRVTEHFIDIGMTDTNGHTLARLQQTIQQADLGLQVAILADSKRQLLALEIKGAKPFRLIDQAGSSILSAIGAGKPSSAAEHARVQIDGGPIQLAQDGIVLLDEGRVRLQLEEAGPQPVIVQIKQDHEAILRSVTNLLEQLNPLVTQNSDEAELLNPELRASLHRILSSPACAMLGFSREEKGNWSLNVEILTSALAADSARVQRELGGPQGWAGRLHQTLTRLIELPAREMMNPADQLMHQFTLYEASMQSYWHVPHSGWMFNEQA